MKRKHPNSNIQHPEKLQEPNSKISSNTAGKLIRQGSDPAQKKEPTPNAYPETIANAWLLHETPQQANNGHHPFDLEERTAKFGEAIVRFSKRIPRNASTNRLIDQLVGCGSSVGANYLEANESFSKKDFRFSISRCVKEAKETKYFLRLIAAGDSSLVEDARTLYRECHELHLIFATIFRKSQKP